MTLGERRKNLAVPGMALFAGELTGKEMADVTGGLDIRTLMKILGKEAKKDFLCSTIASHDFSFTGRCREERRGTRIVLLRERRCGRCGCADWVAADPREGAECDSEDHGRTPPAVQKETVHHP